MDSKDFPVPNELIDKCAEFMWFKFGNDDSRALDFKHALHQLIHDYNGELAKSGYGKISKPENPIEAGAFQSMVSNLEEMQADSVLEVMNSAGSEKMKDTVAYVLTTITASMCFNKLDKIARARKANPALSRAVDELANKIVMGVAEFQRPFDTGDDGNITL